MCVDGSSVTPLPEGAECARTSIGDNEVFALECAGIENPVVISQCDTGRCVAKIGCDGKPLTGHPDVDVDPSGPSPLDPQPTPQPTPAPTPTPGTPSPIPTTPTTPTTPTAPTLPAPGPTTPTTPAPTTPTVPTTPPPAPTPSGPTFAAPGSPFTLGPGQGPIPSGGSFGTGSYPGGVFSGGNPFYPGSTFGGASNWGGGASSGFDAVAANLFTSFFSNIISNLFSGFSGGRAPAGSAAPSAPAPTQPVPQPPVAETPLQPPPQQVAEASSSAYERARLREERLRQLNEQFGREVEFRPTSPFSIFETPLPIPSQPMPDRIGGPIPGESQPPLTGSSPSGLLPSDVVRDAENPSGLSPQPLPEAPLQPSVITRAEAEETFARARSVFDERSGYSRFLDWVGVGSPEGIAFWRAQYDLEAVAMRESLERLAADVRAIPVGVQVAEAGPVMTDAPPVGLEEIERSLTLEQRARFEAEWEAFLQEFDAAQTDAERTDIVNRKFDEIRAIDPAIEDALGDATFAVQFESTVPSPQSEQRPSTMLEGLSRIGERVLEAARALPERVARTFRGGPAPEAPSLPPPAPTPAPDPAAPAPEPQPAPTPAPSQPTPPPAQVARPGFIQGGMNILSTILQGIIGLFSNQSGGSGSSTSPAQTPPQQTPSATLIANPPVVDQGATSQLSWASVGAQGCAIVDATLSVIARGGTSGSLSSPALEASSRFGVICDIEGGRDKFVNETLIRVRGDDSEPERLFAQTGRVSTAPPAPGANTDGASTGTIGDGQSSSGQGASPPPRDVRTCDPQQPMDSFIRCLCEAEPNPAGCAIPPGGV